MPSADNDYDLLPSVLDRLLDDDPRASYEPLASRFYSLGELKQAVVRDLEVLLNTRQEALQELRPSLSRCDNRCWCMVYPISPP